MKKPISVHLPKQLPTILALEASANKLSVALMRNGDVAAERHHISAHGHAASIVPLTIETLNDARESFDTITHVAAGCGPGSFTGIRMTLAAAKGFCMAYQAVGVGLSGLQALASAARHAEPTAMSPCLALADTRRGTLYAQLFDPHEKPISEIFESSLAHLPQTINTYHLTNGIRVVGVEHEAAADTLRLNGTSVSTPFIEEVPSASIIARLAAVHIKLGTINPLGPLYIAHPVVGQE